jgi:hypothetical protein
MRRVILLDSHHILARWWNHFSQPLNVHAVNDVGQTEIHTAEPLVPEPGAYEVEMAIEKLIGHKSPGMEKFPAELMKAGGKTIRCANHKLLNPMWNKACKESIIVPIYKKGDKTDCTNYRGISLLPYTYKV